MVTLAYVRVSTDKQSRDGLSLSAQEKAIRNYCELYDLKLGDVIVDRGVSAKSIKGRPGMQRLIEQVANGSADAVVVYKIDRMFRSIRDALNTFDLFKEHGIKFHSVMEKWDTSTAMGEFAMNMLLSIAQLERRQTSERTRFTLREKKVADSQANPLMSYRTERKMLTVGQAPYGWRWRNKALEPNPKEFPHVKRMRQLWTEGQTIREITRWLKEHEVPTRSGMQWHDRQVRRILTYEFNK